MFTVSTAQGNGQPPASAPSRSLLPKKRRFQCSAVVQVRKPYYDDGWRIGGKNMWIEDKLERNWMTGILSVGGPGPVGALWNEHIPAYGRPLLVDRWGRSDQAGAVPGAVEPLRAL
ncbi:unnamed protein product [Durusdinium trenchii]|uniref:Uncharacterized protein n=1 Tax=Durusdinium trenchii TaxID=1381693 RepID=A0ABP0PGX5_9DINO